jgi:hypothetical protein
MAINIRHGVNALTLENMVGKSVGEVRDHVADILSVPETAQVRVNNVAASDDHVLADCANVEFVKIAGEKGVFVRS